MGKNVNLSIFEIVGSPLCVASDDGQKVYDRIVAALQEDKSVIISFLNVAGVTSAFLNTAIGQLYGSFTEEKIRSKLKVKDIEPDDRALLKRVVETAKEYFKNPDLHRQAAKEEIGETDE